MTWTLKSELGWVNGEENQYSFGKRNKNSRGFGGAKEVLDGKGEESFASGSVLEKKNEQKWTEYTWMNYHFIEGLSNSFSLVATSASR